MRLTQIKLRRLEGGPLQVDVAQRTKIARCRLSELENGHVTPTSDELRRLAGAFGVDVAQLTDSSWRAAVDDIAAE